MQALLHIARTVRREPLDLTADDVEAAHAAGATDGDVQLAVLIAAGLLDVQPAGRRLPGADTPPTPEAYRARAGEIAAHGYSAPSKARPDPVPVPRADRPSGRGRLHAEAVTDRDRRALEDGAVPAERVRRVGVQQVGVDLEEQLLDVLVGGQGAGVPGHRQLLDEPPAPATVELRDPVLHGP